MPMLRPGQELHTTRGQKLVVRQLIGEGGQGEVHRVELDGKEYALKWYHPPATQSQITWHKEQREALDEYLLRITPPDPRFIWPQAAVDDPSGRTYGYLMDLFEPRFKGLEALVLGRMRPVPDFATLCTAAINMAECFRKLHNAGACYKDINLGGPVIDPKTGDVRICDVDNVRVNKTPGNIIFVFFAAPELIRGEEICTTTTDIHSLAVLLFYMFVRHHPLEGLKELKVNVFNEAAQRKFYGKQPLFIFDPNDPSNRPVPGFHDSALRNWPLYPEFLKKRFVRAFTTGLHDPNQRVREGEWMDTFSQLRDSISRCRHCGVENFLDGNGGEFDCWRCDKTSPPPMRMVMGKTVVHLNHNTKLFGHHMGKRLQFSSPAAQVTQHPKDPRKWGLRNEGRRPWKYETRSGEPRTVEPGRSVSIRKGLKVDFGGGVTGVIEG